MGLLENKVAVITGSTRGLGLAMAQAFVREGASVVVASRSAEAVTKTVDTLRAEGGQASGLACDVSDLAQVQALADHALNAFGRFDIWVNNAGHIACLWPDGSHPAGRICQERRRRTSWERIMARSWLCGTFCPSIPASSSTL